MKLGSASNIALACVLWLAIFAGWLQCYSGHNFGLTFGYYGEFNTVGNAIREIPGVTVIGGGGNEDITFEEFCYVITTSQGKEIRLEFGEQDPVRRMSGAKLTDALLAKIEKELSKSEIQRTN